MPPAAHRAAPGLAYGALVAALWPLPVVGSLHAESSAVVAAAAFFVGGAAAVGAFRRGEPGGRVLARQASWLAVPLGMLLVSMLWRPNCAWPVGLGLFAVMAVPSVALGVALAAALVAWGVPRARLALVAVGLLVGVGGTLWTLALHPQMFVYNPVYGGVLGPIYDDELALRPGLFVSRALALAWAGALATGALWQRTRSPRAGRAALALLALAVLAEVAAVPLGMRQSEAAITRSLGRTVDLGPVVLVVDRSAPDERVRRLADEALFRLEQMSERLGARPAEPVTVFVYPDEAAKGALTGARRTSVVPVWLRTPQVHLLDAAVERSLGHEMAHVVAREFGMPGLRASPLVGLVEGLAVAVEPPDGLPAPAALVAAARALPGDAGGLDADPAAVVRQAMHPVGFWSARASVAYTASGAFTAWLLETSGVEAVQRAYRTGRLEASTGVRLDSLAGRWARSLAREPVSAEAVETAAWLFRQPSLFEARCPHHVPPHVRATRAGAAALEAGEAAQATGHFARALALEPRSAAAAAGWVAAASASGRLADAPARRVRARAARADAGPLALRAAADRAALTGDPAAPALYARAAAALPPTDRAARLALAERSRLPADVLARAFATPGDDARTAAALEPDAPLLAAVLWDRALRPHDAWRAVQAVQATPPADRAALALVRARLADHAGDPAALGLAHEAAAALRGDGALAAAALADDLAARVRGRLARAARGGRS